LVEELTSLYFLLTVFEVFLFIRLWYVFVILSILFGYCHS